MKAMFALAPLLVVGGQPPPPPATFGTSVEVCRLAGKAPIEAAVLRARLGDQHQKLTDLICAGYEMGQRDLIGAIQARGAKTRAI